MISSGKDEIKNLLISWHIFLDFSFQISCCSSRTLHLYCQTPSCRVEHFLSFCDGQLNVASVSSTKKYFGGVASEPCPSAAKNGFVFNFWFYTQLLRSTRDSCRNRKWKVILCECDSEIFTSKTRRGHDTLITTRQEGRRPTSKKPRKFQSYQSRHRRPPPFPSFPQKLPDSETNAAWG